MSIPKEKLDSSAESFETLVFHRSPVAEIPLASIGVVLAFVAFVLSKAFPNTVQWIIIVDGILSIPIPLFALMPLLIFSINLHNLFDDRYSIGKDYVRAINGLLSLKKEDVRLSVHDIRGVEISRGLYGRIANVGDIKVGSAMSGASEICMGGVRDPSYYRDIILKRRIFELQKD